VKLEEETFADFAGDVEVLDVATNVTWIPGILTNEHLKDHPGMKVLQKLDEETRAPGYISGLGTPRLVTRSTRRAISAIRSLTLATPHRP